MKQAKRIVQLTTEEYRLMIQGLHHFRNKVLNRGGYADAVSDLLIKLQK